MERTFVMAKPDAVQRRLIGEIIGRLERKGLTLAGMRYLRLTEGQAKELYKPHEGKPFHETLVKFVTSSPAVVSAWEGHQAVAIVRRMIGATFGFNAEPGSIRGDYGCSKGFNLIHASDSWESAQRELAIFFDSKSFVSHAPADLGWVLEPPERS
jgi:nucleoside-diphosphate kinase